MASPSEQTLLVTGANGFVGLHVVQEALSRGYHVRGTVRSQSSADKVLALFPQSDNKLSIYIVSDLSKPELWKSAFSGAKKPITGVISVAAPFSFTADDVVKEILEPALKIAVGVLEATISYGTNVRRVVNISSFAAIVDPLQGYRPGYTYSEKDWSPLSYEQASQGDAQISYLGSKALSEKTMWAWMDKESPPFSLVSINPPWVFGPHVGEVDLKHLNESSKTLWRLVDAKEVPLTDYAAYADVRVVAAAHIKAFEKPEADGARFLLGQRFTYQTAADLIRKEIPELKSRIPEGTPGAGEKEELYLLDERNAENILGVKHIPLEKTLKDTFTQFLEAEKKMTAT